MQFVGVQLSPSGALWVLGMPPQCKKKVAEMILLLTSVSLVEQGDVQCVTRCGTQRITHI